MKVVAAPNPFKGTLGSPAAARAIARGVRRAWPDAEVTEVPVADGGEGTVEALVAAAHGELVEVEVDGPLGEPVRAEFGLIEGGRTAVVELASSSGLPLVPGDRRDPRLTSTYGLGQVLEAARARGVRKIIAGIGGSATNDGGAGMAQALGCHLLDADGRELPRGGAALARLARIDAAGVDRGWREVEVEVAVDVTNPLTGPTGATAVYGPQKGASGMMIEELDSALAHFAEVVARDLGTDVADLPGAGAAGGAGAGFVAFLDAKLVRGAPLVVDAAGFDRALVGAGVVMSGEGRVDGQTAYGKGPAEIAARSARAGVPVVLLAGALGEGWETVLKVGVSAVLPLAEGPSSLEAMERDAEGLVERAAERACRLLGVSC
jgi:glycerate kinase